jgi:esterase/lipase
MRDRVYSRALIFGLSMSGVLAVMVGFVVRLVMIVFGLDLLFRIMGV